jgi:hypothetical protein
VLAREFALPAYFAVRLYFPAARADVGNVATPEEFRVPVPSTVEPFRKLTVPAGTVVSLPLTDAVKVRVLPTATGFGAATSVVVVD